MVRVGGSKALSRFPPAPSDAKAVGVASLITEYRFVCTMLLLCDTLSHITFLSKAFQIADSDYSIILRMLSSTLQSLEALKEVDGINLAGLEMFIRDFTNAGIELKMLSTLGINYFKTTTISDNLNSKSSL